MMKNFFLCLVLMLSCAGFVACGDDDDDNGGGSGTPEGTSLVNPKKVFTAGMPKTVDGYRLTLDDQGRVTKMASEWETVTIEYPIDTRAAKLSSPDVIMTVKNKNKWEIEFLITLNNQGFVSHCEETYYYKDEDPEFTLWDFEYSKDGYLQKMVCSEGGNETTTIKYSGGDITDVFIVSKEDPSANAHYNIVYGSQSIENKGCVMLHDITFGIDLDEMGFAYYAGMLGKATKHLPVTRVETLEDGTEDFYESFEWELNADNMPVSMSAFDGRGEFTW